ncbi:unnamed protein product [Lampetra fluviatilis]
MGVVPLLLLLLILVLVPKRLLQLLELRQQQQEGEAVVVVVACGGEAQAGECLVARPALPVARGVWCRWICALPLGAAGLLSLGLCAAGLKWVVVDRIFEVSSESKSKSSKSSKSEEEEGESEEFPSEFPSETGDAGKRRGGAESRGGERLDLNFQWNSPSTTTTRHGLEGEEPAGATPPLPAEATPPLPAEATPLAPPPATPTGTAAAAAAPRRKSGGHSRPCAAQDLHFCLNGGACSVITGIQQLSCR